MKPLNLNCFFKNTMIMALLLFSTVTFSQNKNPIKEGEIIFKNYKY